METKMNSIPAKIIQNTHSACNLAFLVSLFKKLFYIIKTIQSFSYSFLPVVGKIINISINMKETGFMEIITLYIRRFLFMKTN